VGFSRPLAEDKPGLILWVNEKGRQLGVPGLRYAAALSLAESSAGEVAPTEIKRRKKLTRQLMRFTPKWSLPLKNLESSGSMAWV
jgi:hypothetical protein